MNDKLLETLLNDVASAKVTPDEAVSALQRLPFADLGFARVDHHRLVRQGLPEAIYGPGKTADQCAKIAFEMLNEGSGPVLLTRANPDQVSAALAACPGGKVTVTSNVGSQSLTLSLVAWRPWPMPATRASNVIIVTAGTADLGVAYECQATLEAYALQPLLLPDCGVAGIHRILSTYDDLMAADVVVVVAGMEGALASVVGGLTPAPVVAVPTSTGYGAGLEGVTALLGMHASCAAGITVVGIDNGFGAACAVQRILNGQRHVKP